MHVALAPRVRQLVVLELDALALERSIDILDVVNRPGQRRGFVRASEAGPVHVDRGVPTLERNGLAVFRAGSTEAKRFLIEPGGRVEVPDRERGDRVCVS